MRLAAEDLGTVLGRTLNHITADLNSNVDNLNGKIVTAKLKYEDTAETVNLGVYCQVCSLWRSAGSQRHNSRIYR